MKVKMEIECTAEEARAALGLPDVSTLNAHMVAEVQKRMDANLSSLQPEELLKSWTMFGDRAQEQFRKILNVATGTATRDTDRT
jgi:hypothetical protein